mmetsp:Transcript_70408/g.205937  ORF Transcript_70408/g.205937 Transcript_70408/m.205937 type:complete len:201 (+) Transcript_70408:141-743(+)
MSAQVRFFWKTPGSDSSIMEQACSTASKEPVMRTKTGSPLLLPTSTFAQLFFWISRILHPPLPMSFFEASKEIFMNSSSSNSTLPRRPSPTFPHLTSKIMARARSTVFTVPLMCMGLGSDLSSTSMVAPLSVRMRLIVKPRAPMICLASSLGTWMVASSSLPSSSSSSSDNVSPFLPASASLFTSIFACSTCFSDPDMVT